MKREKKVRNIIRFTTLGRLCIMFSAFVGRFEHRHLFILNIKYFSGPGGSAGNNSYLINVLNLCLL